MSSVADAQHLVNQTRHEITEIVREVALAVRSDRTLNQFFGFLADRVLRAMAAEGVVVWQRVADPHSEHEHWTARARLGPLTDRSFNELETTIHDRLLQEISESATPVVVPPTPHAVEQSVPANPAPYPAALAPIESSASGRGAEYVLEVFLEPGGSVATQRGYLRFVAQMSDLAGEFIRRDEVRRWQHHRNRRVQLETVKQSLHEANDEARISNLLVDAIADTFGFARVALCAIRQRNGHPQTATILAVSYVE